MFSFFPVMRTLMCVYMGVVLGLAATLIYMGFLMTHLYLSPEPMVLTPVEVVNLSKGVKS